MSQLSNNGKTGVYGALTLEHMLDCELVKNIRNLQIQFHRHSPGYRHIPDAEERMKNIQHRLALTHHLTYQFLYNWENWERNS